MKICSRCKKELNSDMFDKNKSKGDGLSCYCKECGKEYRKEYRKENRNAMNLQTKEWIDNNKEHVIETRKLYYKKNKGKNKENRKIYAKQYHIDNREHENKRTKNWALNNKERYKEISMLYKESHKEYIRIQNRQYTKEHAEQNCINVQKRRARKLLLPCTLTPSQWETIKLSFNNKCAYCGKEKFLEKEHFIALTNLGEFTINNVIPACRYCNASKRNDDFFEWYPKFKFYNKTRERKILTYLNYKNKVQQLKII